MPLRTCIIRFTNETFPLIGQFLSKNGDKIKHFTVDINIPVRTVHTRLEPVKEYSLILHYDISVQEIEDIHLDFNRMCTAYAKERLKV